MLIRKNLNRSTQSKPSSLDRSSLRVTSTSTRQGQSQGRYNYCIEERENINGVGLKNQYQGGRDIAKIEENGNFLRKGSLYERNHESNCENGMNINRQISSDKKSVYEQIYSSNQKSSSSHNKTIRKADAHLCTTKNIVQDLSSIKLRDVTELSGEKMNTEEDLDVKYETIYRENQSRRTENEGQGYQGVRNGRIEQENGIIVNRRDNKLIESSKANGYSSIDRIKPWQTAKFELYNNPFSQRQRIQTFKTMTNFNTKNTKPGFLTSSRDKGPKTHQISSSRQSEQRRSTQLRNVDPCGMYETDVRLKMLANFTEKINVKISSLKCSLSQMRNVKK